MFSGAGIQRQHKVFQPLLKCFSALLDDKEDDKEEEDKKAEMDENATVINVESFICWEEGGKRLDLSTKVGLCQGGRLFGRK